MESILDNDDKKVFIYNILNDYSSNMKLMNDILQIVDNYQIPRTENGNGTFINLSKITDKEIINRFFLIVQTFNHTQNSIQEDNSISYVKEIKEYIPLNEEKILVDHEDIRLLNHFKSI